VPAASYVEGGWSRSCSCAALVAVGVVLVVRWGGGPPEPSAACAVPERSALARLVRYAAITLAAGLGAGLVAAGAGGRLAMRLLAVTSPDVHGTFTEAGAVIGEITFGGTLGFVGFIGVAAGLLSGAVYALMLPALPHGRAGGLALGAILLVLAGARIDPLRAENVDFALLGPDWLAVALFTMLSLFQGMLVVALAGRLSRGAPLTPPVPLGGRALTAARIAAAVVVLAALPGFLGAVADIVWSA
jgi:hypothetical protein